MAYLTDRRTASTQQRIDQLDAKIQELQTSGGHGAELATLETQRAHLAVKVRNAAAHLGLQQLAPPDGNSSVVWRHHHRDQRLQNWTLGDRRPDRAPGGPRPRAAPGALRHEGAHARHGRGALRHPGDRRDPPDTQGPSTRDRAFDDADLARRRRLPSARGGDRGRDATSRRRPRPDGPRDEPWSRRRQDDDRRERRGGSRGGWIAGSRRLGGRSPTTAPRGVRCGTGTWARRGREARPSPC